MAQWLEIPHRMRDGLCPVNGIRDLIQWRSARDWSNAFVWGLGLGGGFAYLRYNAADPPRQVFWGNGGPRQHKYLAELFTANYREIENRSFKFSLKKAQEAVDAGTPPVIGPLDMYYLPFYEGLYQQRHIPIHYLLLVGYDETTGFVYDTGNEAVQALSLEELQSAWDVNVPGLGKRNRQVIMDIPEDIPPTETLIKQSICDQCHIMLNPPVSMLGIPAMKKLANELPGWPAELGQAAAEKSLLQVREYLNSPPDLEGDHLTAGRHLYITFLEEAQTMAGLGFSTAISKLKESMAVIPEIAKAIRDNHLEKAANGFARIAEIESEAFTELHRLIGDVPVD